ncbi:MAG: 5-formyltetrahydrofolate cyclo-ligase [Oligoflexia bacterium]|nr:5-formyltetrahydrofolate cyclo-ligase [Oligoflexia bacterium]
MKKVLGRLDDRWLQAASRELCAQLTRLVETEIPRDIEHVLAWVSFFPGEVDLSKFITEQLDKRNVYLPRTLPDHSMNFISIGKDWMGRMESGHLGIPEPGEQSGKLYEPAWSHQTLVVVPGLAFDSQGSRLGRGGGFYDRFFARPPMIESVKVGVCWKLQIVESVPTESHDMMIDWICHEEGWVRTGFEEDDSFDQE